LGVEAGLTCDVKYLKSSSMTWNLIPIPHEIVSWNAVNQAADFDSQVFVKLQTNSI
jgi:hypothetical protein